MDAIDRKILALLQQDASHSVAEIGNKVGLSSTPCWKRIQRLEADGVIQRRVALVDQDKIGLGVTVFVSIETGDHSREWLTRFAEVVGAMPEVMEFYRMAGDVDYMLRVVVPDIQGYDAFYKQLIAAVPLTNVTSRFAMEKIKSTTALPISRAEIIIYISPGKAGGFRSKAALSGASASHLSRKLSCTASSQTEQPVSPPPHTRSHEWGAADRTIRIRGILRPVPFDLARWLGDRAETLRCGASCHGIGP